MNQEKIGKFILDLRNKHKLTQAEFANKLNVTAQAVSKWENGRGIPDIELIKKISEKFNVDVSEIINGEKQKKKYLIYWIVLFIILICIIMIVILNNNHNFHFSNLSSNNEIFEVKGVAAYSADKKSIYISKIEYLGEDNIEEYLVVECSLYETNKNVDKIISACGGSIENNSDTDVKTLKSFLETIEFNVDNYDSMCKNLNSNSLYLAINALNKDNKVVTYKIPINIDDTCMN